VDDHHQTKAWAVHIPRLVSMLDSRAEMLRVLLRASISHHIFCSQLQSSQLRNFTG